MVQDKASFDAIEGRFKQVIDAEGRPFLDLCRRYWDDPDYREQINREVAEKRRRGGKR